MNKVYSYEYSQAYNPSMPVIEIGLNTPGNTKTEMTLGVGLRFGHCSRRIAKSGGYGLDLAIQAERVAQTKTIA